MGASLLSLPGCTSGVPSWSLRPAWQLGGAFDRSFRPAQGRKARVNPGCIPAPRTGGERCPSPSNRRRLLKIKPQRVVIATTQQPLREGGKNRATGASGGEWGRRGPAGAGQGPPALPSPSPPPGETGPEIGPGARFPRIRRRGRTDLTKRSTTWMRIHARAPSSPTLLLMTPHPLRAQAAPFQPAGRGDWVRRWASEAHPAEGAVSPEVRVAPARRAGSALLAEQAWSRASFCPGSSFPLSRY